MGKNGEEHLAIDDIISKDDQCKDDPTATYYDGVIGEHTLCCNIFNTLLARFELPSPMDVLRLPLCRMFLGAKRQFPKQSWL